MTDNVGQILIVAREVQHDGIRSSYSYVGKSVRESGLEDQTRLLIGSLNKDHEVPSRQKLNVLRYQVAFRDLFYYHGMLWPYRLWVHWPGNV